METLGTIPKQSSLPQEGKPEIQVSQLAQARVLLERLGPPQLINALTPGERVLAVTNSKEGKTFRKVLSDHGISPEVMIALTPEERHLLTTRGGRAYGKHLRHCSEFFLQWKTELQTVPTTALALALYQTDRGTWQRVQIAFRYGTLNLNELETQIELEEEHRLLLNRTDQPEVMFAEGVSDMPEEQAGIAGAFGNFLATIVRLFTTPDERKGIEQQTPEGVALLDRLTQVAELEYENRDEFGLPEHVDVSDPLRDEWVLPVGNLMPALAGFSAHTGSQIADRLARMGLIEEPSADENGAEEDIEDDVGLSTMDIPGEVTDDNVYTHNPS